MRSVSLCVALLLSGAPQTCVSQAMAALGQEPPLRVPDRVKFAALQHYDGFTFCTDRGVFSFVRTGLSDMNEADTKVHEAKHQEQSARFPSCQAWWEYYRTPKGEMEAEAEAYAAGWCVSAKMGADTISLRQSYVEKIERGLGGGPSRLEIVQAFNRYAHCEAK